MPVRNHAWSPDVILFPVAELNPELRSSLGLVEGEFALNLIGKSQGSQILNREAAALLALFRNSCTAIEAIEELARSEGQPVQKVLPGAMALIARWRQNGVLVDRDAPHAESAPAIPNLGGIGPYRVNRLVRSGISTELYLVETDAHELSLLKISNPGHQPFVARQLEREALAMERLDGVCAPALLERGTIDERAFLRMEWLSGNEVHLAASKLRMNPHDTRGELLELIRSVVKACASIHRAGVIHGDVHPGNILVSPSHEIRIVDYGLSRLVGESDGLALQRGGFPFFFEPEYAQALLENLPPPQPTQLGDEYGLAAVIYFLLNGEHYLDFKSDREAALGQILSDTMRPFSSFDSVPWPEVEAILSKALAKNPASRYPSVESFEIALEKVSVTSRSLGENASVCEEALVALLNPRLPLEPPRASVGYGAAGIAYVLRRAACVMERPDLLAAADLWVDRAWKEAAKPGGLTSSKYKIGDAVATPASLYYGLAGIHIVGALVGQTRGELRPLGRAIEYFASLDEAIPSEDVISGSAGALLGCALLLELHPRVDVCEIETLISTGHRLCQALVRKLTTSSPTARTNGLQLLGAAHGWAGALQAVMRWHGGIGTRPAPSIADWLRELASLASFEGGRMSWPISHTDPRRLGGWCHGAAGYVSLWATAYQLFADEEFLRLMLRSAEYVWKFPERSIGQLCCGLVGQAESLLTAYRLTGDRRWIERAGRFASFIDRRALSPHSLMKGDIGVALLDLDLAAPNTSGIPFFDRERL
jgi:eukaryotic-like serine/threonine-protein kinase